MTTTPQQVLRDDEVDTLMETFDCSPYKTEAEVSFALIRCAEQATLLKLRTPPVLPTGWTFRRLDDGAIGIRAPHPKPGECMRVGHAVYPTTGNRDLHDLLGKLADHQAEALGEEKASVSRPQAQGVRLGGPGAPLPKSGEAARVLKGLRGNPVKPEPDFVARGMRYEDAIALCKECVAQAGVVWIDGSTAINVLQRVANQAHKAGFNHALKQVQMREERFYLGACITDGKLYATVMSREANGHVSVVATAELDEKSLRGNDGLAEMVKAHTAAQAQPAFTETWFAMLDTLDEIHGKDWRKCRETLHDSLLASPQAQPEQAAPVAECAEEHPNNRYLFKQMCSKFGIELGHDTIAEALKKINEPQVAQGVGEVVPTTEFCWLVEHFLGDGTGNSTGHYHTGFTNMSGGSRSTDDPLQAKRYSTWKEANAASVRLGHTLSGTWRAVQHGFTTHAPAPVVAGPDEHAVALMAALAKRCYAMSESHLSGARLIVGFERLDDASDAHMAIAGSPRTAPVALPMTEEHAVLCLVKAGCIGTVKMSYDTGPYGITRTSINADKLIRAVEAHHGITTQAGEKGAV